MAKSNESKKTVSFNFSFQSHRVLGAKLASIPTGS